jgi:membrane AbrB-like protein
MMPGGLNQMMLMADEDPRADANVVVMQQTIRLFGVVISVPFLVIHLLGASVVPQGLLAPVGDNTGLTWLLMIPVAGIGSVVAKKLKVPTAALIGPIFATAAFSIICAVNLQKPPPILMNLAQLNIGLYMGCMLDKERLLRTRVLLPYAIIGTLLIIGGSIVVAEILVRYYGIPIVTAFLAMAPGGMTEMCLAGMSMGADVSIILTYQIVRLLMMNLTVPFILRRYFDDSYTG